MRTRATVPYRRLIYFFVMEKFGTQRSAEQPKIMSPEEVDRYARFIQDKVEKWEAIKPDVVLVCESTALLLAHGIKEGYKVAHPDSVPTFHRINPRDFEGPWSWDYDSFKTPLRAPTYGESLPITSYDDAIAASLEQENAHVGAVRAEKLQATNNGRVIIFDETPYLHLSPRDRYNKKTSKFEGTAKPLQIFAGGVLTKKAREILSKEHSSGGHGNTIRAAIHYAMRLGFKDIWVDNSEPSDYYGSINVDHKFTSPSEKNAIGPIHSQFRQEADASLYDFKIAGRKAGEAVKKSRE